MKKKVIHRVLETTASPLGAVNMRIVCLWPTFFSSFKILIYFYIFTFIFAGSLCYLRLTLLNCVGRPLNFGRSCSEKYIFFNSHHLLALYPRQLHDLFIFLSHVVQVKLAIMSIKAHVDTLRPGHLFSISWKHELNKSCVKQPISAVRLNAEYSCSLLLEWNAGCHDNPNVELFLTLEKNFPSVEAGSQVTIHASKDGLRQKMCPMSAHWTWRTGWENMRNHYNISSTFGRPLGKHSHKLRLFLLPSFFLIWWI